MLKQYIVLIVSVLISTFSAISYADDEEQNTKPTFAYYTLAPDLTTNVYTKGKKLAYLQVRVDLMVADSSYVVELERHEPLIRDTIVAYIGEQTEDQVKTLAGREELRRQLKENLNNLLIAETGRTLIADLLFTKFLYQ
ncbi:flagellar basal body-associated protein FliL [Vibrio algarum]|uniref:Flagellar protein FliL n=1 Tax=Vibrio algarum TaxID=3020714 RepID=A0ABT4YMQ5_9VIBR|nr:flagellar basal body-associated protein FliL [Vibrio sp. KJ40-1]MDB1122685.1 flagellar basal body-associated protein FliL [Vibrio sp. KJ40-1]